jgi:zinc D-Ala-D-Ala carboxypeptidase
MNLNYFSLSEFDCPGLPNSGKNMDIQFLSKLEEAREIAGIPFKITSGYRSVRHNKEVGGVQNSSHLIGVAADIAVGSGNERYIILNALIRAGFKRIGVAKTFIHCDTDPNKNNSVWTY